MQPKRGTDIIEIPITFDNRGGNRTSVQAKPLWAFFIFLFWLLSTIFAVVVTDGFWATAYPIISFIILSYVVRFVIVRERYFKKKRKELVENEYMFNHSLFWNIYEISSKHPYIASFGNGMKGIFVAFDKDVIVGKDDDYDYFHHEAIANAYQQADKRGIEWIHIDYMDTVGKDERLKSLFAQAEMASTDDLKRVLTKTYDHIEYTMNRVYASYDVYCFYSTGRDDLFWDELQIVLQYFSKANYIRYRLLNRDSISELVKSLMNIDDFSVNRANDNLFKELYQGQFIRPIWVEADGNRTVMNKTLEEIAEAERVRKAERKVKRKGNKVFKKKQEEPEIDLFD